MLQERPSSNIGSNSGHGQLQGLRQFPQAHAGSHRNLTGLSKPSTAPGGIRVGRSNGPGGRILNRGHSSGLNHNKNNLQKVYGNIVDLVGFEEQHLVDLI